MDKGIRNWLKAHPYCPWFYPICIIVTAVLFWFAPITHNGFIWLYLGVAVLFLLAFRPKSALYKSTVENVTMFKSFFSVLVAAATIAVCVLPMDRLPIWNGEVPGHRNQYELMAESILEGHIDIVYGDEEGLAQLENPYNPVERKESGVKYHWDHAYYNGHYYMYFGIVPVFLAFLPYRIITGNALTTYHATQLFVAMTVIGIFLLFYLLSKLFFKKLPYILYLMLSVAFSVMSIWYSIAEPALYCTAITCAIALEIWSLYFFIRAVWGEKRENRQILFAFFGALLGALVFGCRPPIALANILVLPMLIVFLKQRKFTLKLFGKLVLASLPYAFTAAALMLYNYARFENPFEFGQAYQLTVADQTQYSISLNLEMILRVFDDTINNFFGFRAATDTFPYLKTCSVFFNFPILLLCIGMFKISVLKRLKDTKLLPLTIGLILTVLIITVVDIMWTPYLLERYRMDIYFLMSIACFIVIGLWHDSCSSKRRPLFNSAIAVLSAITVLSAFLLCIRTVGNYYPDKVIEISNILHLNS